MDQGGRGWTRVGVGGRGAGLKRVGQDGSEWASNFSQWEWDRMRVNG